jgi:hypothetical protein
MGVMKVKINKVILLLVLTIILLAGIAKTGLSFIPSVYVDPNTGLQINRSTPEYTVVSYYELFEKKSYDGAYEIFTPVVKKMITPQDLALQFKNIKVNSTRITKVFPSMQVKNFAAVVFIRNLSVPASKEDQVVTGVHFLTHDSFGGLWSIVGLPNEIPQDLQVALYEDLIKLDEALESQVNGLEGYSAKQKASLTKQLKSQALSNKNLLEQVKQSIEEGTNLEAVNQAQEFLKEFAPERVYFFNRNQDNNNFSVPNMPNHPVID